MNNMTLFWSSLKRHPGIPVALMWAMAVAVALGERVHAEGHALRALAIWTAFSALPWLPILATAWTGRHGEQE